MAARSGFGLGKAPLLSPFATQACQYWPLLGALPRRAQRQVGRGVDGVRGDLAAHAVPAARPRAVRAGRLPPAENQFMAQGHDGVIVVIVVLVVVRASSGSSSSRLAVVVVAVVVGNTRALILKHNPTPSRTPSSVSGPGASCGSNLRGQLACQPSKRRAFPRTVTTYRRWDCEEFLAAAARHTHQLWHPVKDRACWAAYLDACDATGCHTPAPPLQPYCRDEGGSVRKCTPGRDRQPGHFCVTNCSI